MSFLLDMYRRLAHEMAMFDETSSPEADDLRDILDVVWGRLSQREKATVNQVRRGAVTVLPSDPRPASGPMTARERTAWTLGYLAALKAQQWRAQKALGEVTALVTEFETIHLEGEGIPVDWADIADGEGV